MTGVPVRWDRRFHLVLGDAQLAAHSRAQQPGDDDGQGVRDRLAGGTRRIWLPLRPEGRSGGQFWIARAVGAVPTGTEATVAPVSGLSTCRASAVSFRT
ncbi:hypothetical protein FrEUN1fDRAFT_3925 [Parafrankia sp. EUN1f]|nr:hypothetical protein FrEUN1fDRAFT_3925 [Parafrankia sp. EUN1f]